MLASGWPQDDPGQHQDVPRLFNGGGSSRMAQNGSRLTLGWAEFALGYVEWLKDYNRVVQDY